MRFRSRVQSFFVEVVGGGGGFGVGLLAFHWSNEFKADLEKVKEREHGGVHAWAEGDADDLGGGSLLLGGCKGFHDLDESVFCLG